MIERQEVESIAEGLGQGQARVWLMDTITKVTPDDAGSIVVSGSHGGTSSGSFALAAPLKLAVFNDAGVGKDSAGIAALDMLAGARRAPRPRWPIPAGASATPSTCGRTA